VRVAKWKTAAEELAGRFQRVLASVGDQVDVTTWNALLHEGDVRYNATGLTLDFADQTIVVKPRGLTPHGVGVVEASCGTRAFRFLWTGGTTWRFDWENPKRSAEPEPVTDDAIEHVIEALLA
jgi:hypothetical protein